MSFPRPEQVVVDIESVVREYLRPSTSVSPPGDLPPKYEEIGEDVPPPQYDESTMRDCATLDSTQTEPATEEAIPKDTTEEAKEQKENAKN